MSNTPTPIDYLNNEARAASFSPEEFGMLEILSGENWIHKAEALPDPTFFFHRMIVEGEIIVVYASSNVGKSVFCVQMAADIARTRPVLYVDSELSCKQWQMRYWDPDTKKKHLFPGNFLRAQINLTKQKKDGSTVQQQILQAIEYYASARNIRIVFVDNLTFLCNNTEDGLSAGDFMMELIRLKQLYGLTLVVIAHTPKRDGKSPIEQNDLAGSSRLMNFFDSGIAIGRSAKDPQLRYVKQVKVRTGEFVWGANHVALYRLEKTNAFTHFEYLEPSTEQEHLRPNNTLTEMEDLQEIARLRNEGRSVREIARETGMPSTTVKRKLDKARAQGLVNPETDKIALNPVQEQTKAE